MASQTWATTAAITLWQQHPQMSLWQLLRLIDSKQSPVGESISPAQDVVHLGTTVSLAYSVHDIHQIKIQNNRYHIQVNSIGLLNKMAVLPLYLHDIMLQQQQDDSVLNDFINLFNHRLLCLYYQAFRKTRLYLDYESNPQHNNYNNLLSAVTGCNQMSCDELSVEERLFYASLLNPRIRHKSNLHSLLQHYFQLPLQIISNCGQWQPIDTAQQTKLTLVTGPGQYNQLGHNAVIGKRTWSIEHKIRIQIGPLHLKTFKQFLPQQPHLQKLRGWLRLYLSQHLDHDIQLIIQKDQIPGCQLGAPTLQLGYTSWIHSQTPTKNCDQFIIGANHGHA